MGADPSEDVAEVGVRLDADALRGLDQRVEDRGALAAFLAAAEDSVFRPTATRRMARFDALLSIGIRLSLANRQSPPHWFWMYAMALPRLLAGRAVARKRSRTFSIFMRIGWLYSARSLFLASTSMSASLARCLMG